MLHPAFRLDRGINSCSGSGYLRRKLAKGGIAIHIRQRIGDEPAAAAGSTAFLGSTSGVTGGRGRERAGLLLRRRAPSGERERWSSRRSSQRERPEDLSRS